MGLLTILEREPLIVSTTPRLNYQGPEIVRQSWRWSTGE